MAQIIRMMANCLPRCLPVGGQFARLTSAAIPQMMSVPAIRTPLYVLSSHQFHATGSKIHYLDFRHRFRPNWIKKNMLIIRRAKMKKHKRRKWRRKFKMMIAKKRLKREIAKEKAFRVELLTIIRQAENFDPREYALRKIAEINSIKPSLSREESLEQIKELIRQNRHQVDYIKPTHRKRDIV